MRRFFGYLNQGGAFYRKLLALMLPLILQNIVSFTLALADTLMVGMLGERQLAAMTVANNPFFVLQVMIFGIQSGACVLVAQYHGKKDADTINRVLGAGFYAGVLFTGAASLFILLFPRPLMGLLTDNAALVPLAAEYARYVTLAYVLASVSGVYIAIQRSVENTRFGAWVLASSAVLNVALNYALIFGRFGAPRLGIVGAAVATVLSRLFEVAAVVAHAAASRRLPMRLNLILRPGREITRDFIRYALPVTINETLWSLGMSLFTVVMGHMPDNTAILAAYSITGGLDRIVSVVMFAMGNAAAIVVGKEIGAGGRETVFGKAMALEAVALVIGVLNLVMLLGVRFFLAERFLYPLLNLSAAAYRTANLFLVLYAIASPLRAPNMLNIVGVLRGGGDVRTAMILDVLPIYLFALPAAAFAGLVLDAGIAVVFSLRLSDELIKAIFTWKRIASKKWIRNVTRDFI